MAHLTRFYMYKQIKNCFKNKIKGNILSISGIDYIQPLISADAKVLNSEYPVVDMQNMPYNNDSFDFVISDQVIEHLENPRRAIRESHRVLKNGGIAIHTSCFINHIHLCPHDFWRFSPSALKLLCKDFSEIICCGGWGNRIAILLVFLSVKFRFMKIPETKYSFKHLIASWNEAKYPIVTWIVVKK